jgi:hypothetical protein
MASWGAEHMVILRLLSYLLIAATLMLLGYDAITWLQASGGEHHLFSLAKLIETLVGTDKYASMSGGWPDVVKTALAWPAWAYTGVLGLIFAFVSRSHG